MSRSLVPGEPFAWFGGVLATRLAEVSDDPAVLDTAGWWAVVRTFEGALTCARFADVRPAPLPAPVAGWSGPAYGTWRSSMDRDGYVRACEEVRRRIARGEVYQVNVCRILEAPDPGGDVLALASALARGNPAPYAGVVRIPGLEVVTASPELYLSREGRVVESRPIKGTGVRREDLLDKDAAENVMIVDLVRNDLGTVCATGSVTVPGLLEVEQHPGLVHLVSTVRGRLREGAGWPDLFAGTFPPGSVSGAPKTSALRAIADVEPVARGPYCGAVGWVDADREAGALAVGIRTFWRTGGRLRFGTGAGITWGSDPEREWDETLLKARRLVALASSGGASGAGGDEEAT